MKEQILDRLARLLKYFKGLEHENNEKEYAYILKGTINGITYSIKNVEDFFENSDKEDSNKKYLYASAKNLQISQYLQHFLDTNHLKPGEHFYLTNKNGERVFEKSTFEIGCDGIFSIHNTPICPFIDESGQYCQVDGKVLVPNILCVNIEGVRENFKVLKSGRHADCPLIEIRERIKK